ncbi:hypothetical protein Trydic_g12850 [Trypoxylus dichotomus]
MRVTKLVSKGRRFRESSHRRYVKIIATISHPNAGSTVSVQCEISLESWSCFAGLVSSRSGRDGGGGERKGGNAATGQSDSSQ